MTRVRRPVVRWLRSAAIAFATLAGSSAAFAADRYALVVSGASGGPQYAQKYDAWRTAFVTLLRQKFGYPEDHVIVLSEEGSGSRKATRENVRAALTDLRRRVAHDDVVIVLTIGHGTAADSESAKFNLVGPDLSAGEWASLVKGIAGRLVFIDGTAASFPFLRQLAAPGRVILTATDSPGQQFETVFPEFLIKAFEESSADLDKNGKVSIWEAFLFASAAVKSWYEERGLLVTERPLLDDTGTGIGRDATPAPSSAEGALARTTFLQPDVMLPAGADTELERLLRRRAELESAIEQLRVQKPTITPQQYETELERLVTELARLDQQIRAKR